MNVLDYGIIGDGVTDNTASLQKLLDRVGETGGELRFPAGKYVTGSLRIYSNTTLYLEAGSFLLASEDKSKYPVITEEKLPGFVRGTRQGILFALNGENIAIRGEGTIDGRGHVWWDMQGTDEMRPRTIQFININRVTVDGIHIINSPCWTVHPIHCNNVTIHNISIINPYESPNTDGINPESCKNVKISNCYIDVGDDCVTIKSGLERDLFQKQFPCENITVTNCTFVHGHGGIVIGSEMSGGVKNMTVSNCIFQNTDRGIRIKTRRKRGGSVEDILISNVIMDNVIAGITMNQYYSCGASPDDVELFTYEPRPVVDSTPRISGISISNVIMKNVLASGIYFLGLPEQPIEDVKIINVDIRVTGCPDGERSISVHNIEKSYGDGIVLRNVKKVDISGCSLFAKEKEFIFENAEETFINGERI